MALAQAVLFLWQLRIMQETTDATARNAYVLVNAERAHLWPGFGSARLDPDPDGGVHYTLTILNTGRRPGTVEAIFVAVVTEPDYEAGRVQYTEYSGHGDIITPNKPASSLVTMKAMARIAQYLSRIGM